MKPVGLFQLGDWTMKEKKDIRKYSLKELREMRDRNETKSDPNAQKYSVDKDFWENARVVMPDSRPKQHTGIRLDADVLDWFKSQGKGWQTRINAVLRSYYENHHTPS